MAELTSARATAGWASLPELLRSPRMLVFGNSGSGKSCLATRLGAVSEVPVLDLDQVFWEDGDFRHSRPPHRSRCHVNRFAGQRKWIIEGVYTHLLTLVEPVANLVVWLDLNHQECRCNIERRGGIKDDYLLRRVEDYYSRRAGSSWWSHHTLFSEFSGRKIRLCSNKEAGLFSTGGKFPCSGP